MPNIFPGSGSPLNNSATGAAAGAVSCALTPAAGRLAWIQGFHITSTNPASSLTGAVTVTGVNTVNGVPLTYQLVESATFGGELLIFFPGDGLSASAVGQAITVSVPAIATGGVVSIVAFGYQD